MFWLFKTDKIYPGSTTHGSMRIYHPSRICIWQVASWSGVCGSSLKTNPVLWYRQILQSNTSESPWYPPLGHLGGGGISRLRLTGGAAGFSGRLGRIILSFVL